MTERCPHGRSKPCCVCVGFSNSCCCCEYFCCRCEYSQDVNDAPSLEYWCGRTGEVGLDYIIEGVPSGV